MKRQSLGKWISIFGLTAAGSWLLSLSSCARSQELTAITIQPATFTFLSPDPTLSANFTALGTYIHPPETKDISALVTWSSDVPQLLTVTGGTVNPSGSNGCGVANVSASYNHGTYPDGNLVTGYSTVTINNSLEAICPGGTAAPILSVTPEQTNTTGNSVTSNPVGINCPAQSCGAPFASGTAVTLTATPSGNFVSWGTSCPGATTNVCVVALTSNETVTAIFQ
jgi:hypothetical protein